MERLKKEEYANAKKAYNDLSPSVKPIFEYLHTEKCLYITSYSEKEALFCRFFDIPLDIGKAFLSELSEKIFLVAPSTQVYLFMPEKEKKLIFQAYQKRRASYELALRRTKAELPNFFTYDFFSTDIIVKYFQDARNLDFEQAVNTGEYGHRYQQILNDINQILMPGKKILPQIQSSQAKASEDDPIEGIIFKTENGEILYPEDLSHGVIAILHSLYIVFQKNKFSNTPLTPSIWGINLGLIPHIEGARGVLGVL